MDHATPRRRPPARGGLHPLTRAFAPMHALFRGPLRWYFASTPGWVLLTTYGRHTGRPYEVPLPCARTTDTVIVVSAYGERSDWMRNIRRNPSVIVTWAGRRVPAIAEVVDDTGKETGHCLSTSVRWLPAARGRAADRGGDAVARPPRRCRAPAPLRRRPAGGRPPRHRGRRHPGGLEVHSSGKQPPCAATARRASRQRPGSRASWPTTEAK